VELPKHKASGTIKSATFKREVLPRFGFSDGVIGKIAFSYSYCFAELIFPSCEKVFWKAQPLEDRRT
jgi:hypothetical protein